MKIVCAKCKKDVYMGCGCCKVSTRTPQHKGKNKMESTGYIIVCNNNIIQGVGTSVDEAWSNVVRDAGPWIGLDGKERDTDEVFTSGMYKVYPCTQG
jgi:hypothetical protein